ncbi:MAG: two-component system response regulator [Thermoplasmata archaeon]|nr:MAG: two-component system response regulator [Thermoplasmata archaeon]
MKKKKILVADDEPEIVDIVKRMLEDEYEVITAYDGEEALEKAKKEKPDLILLDILMPKLDGWETLKKLKEDEELKNIPVSMLTALPLTPDDTKEKPIDKIENYIVKPFTKETLLKKIKDIFEREEEAKKTYEELKKEVGEEIAEEYMKLVRAINRHRRLIGVIIDSAAEEYKQSVRNLILSQKRLIETMKKRAEEIEKLLEEKRKKGK